MSGPARNSHAIFHVHTFTGLTRNAPGMLQNVNTVKMVLLHITRLITIHHSNSGTCLLFMNTSSTSVADFDAS